MGVVAITSVVKSNWQVKIASRIIETVGMPRLSTFFISSGNIWSSAMTKNALEPWAIYEQKMEQLEMTATMTKARPAQLPTY